MCCVKYGLDEYAIIFKAMSDETRLKILTMLFNGKTCACHLLEEFQFTQPTLSYHMKQLTDSGLVEAEKIGKWVHYSINKKRVELLSVFISKVQRLGNLSCCVREEKMQCDNVKKCDCPKTICPNYGRCCACIIKHRTTDSLPFCLFENNGGDKSNKNYYEALKKRFDASK